MSASTHCSACGMCLYHPAEYHPYIFCVMFRAGRDPWPELLRMVEQLGLDPDQRLSHRPPLVRELSAARARAQYVTSESQSDQPAIQGEPA